MMRINLLGWCIGLLLTVAVSATETPERIPGLTIPKAKEPVSDTQQCVEPLDIIRSTHGKLLKRQRDDTMRRGIRTERYSFVGCIDCHVTPNETGKYPSVDTPEHFCNSCHTYAAVHVDCFDCHAAKPELSEPVVANQEKIDGLGIVVSQLLDPHAGNRAGAVVILDVVANTQALQQGIHQGDVITHINGQVVAGRQFADVVINSLRGAAGSTVELTTKRGAESRTVTLTRQ